LPILFLPSIRSRQMNAHSRIADTHSINFDFEEMEIEEDGLFFGSFWGTAELALNDARDGDYYIKHIVLRGDRIERNPIRFGLRIRKRVPGFLALTRPAKDNQSFHAHLFRALEARLYEDETAKAVWADQMESA
ncbi:hypothetical protein LB579_34060, partial [Mesorhizobium sp. BR1-1-7]|uniref:hypothetical protein n=1 Tax=Mesorhizobium sp. BR1-1-7 TaxID=2876647 RepID=UPI001CCD6C4C